MIYRIIAFVGLFFFMNTIFGQHLPPSYELMFQEIAENFKEIRGGNSLNEGKNSLRLLSEDRIVLRMEHKRKVKTLTFAIKKDEEGSSYWMSANQLTTDMVEKYEDDLTKVLDDMLELSRDKAKQ